jgi:hypothetical protein
LGTKPDFILICGGYGDFSMRVVEVPFFSPVRSKKKMSHRAGMYLAVSDCCYEVGVMGFHLHPFPFGQHGKKKKAVLQSTHALKCLILEK